MADNAAKIAILRNVLASGAKTVTVDGVSTTYRDRADIIAEINYLEESDDANDYTKKRAVKTINLGNF